VISINKRMSREEFQALLALLFFGYAHADSLGVIGTTKHGQRLIFQSLVSHASLPLNRIEVDELPEGSVREFESTILHAVNGNHDIGYALGQEHVACENEEFRNKALNELGGKYVTQVEFESFIKSNIRENEMKSNCKNCVIQLNNDEFSVGAKAKIFNSNSPVKFPGCAFHGAHLKSANQERNIGFEIEFTFLPSRSGYQLRCKRVAISLRLQNSMLNVLRIIGEGKVNELASRMRSLEDIVLHAERPKLRSEFIIRVRSSASHHHELTFLPQLSREGIGLSMSFLTEELHPFEAMEVQDLKMNEQDLHRSILFLRKDIEHVWDPNLLVHNFSLFDRVFVLQTLESISAPKSVWPIYQIEFMNTKNSLIEPANEREFLDICFNHRLVTTSPPSGIKTGFQLGFSLTDFGLWRVM